MRPLLLILSFCAVGCAHIKSTSTQSAPPPIVAPDPNAVAEAKKLRRGPGGVTWTILEERGTLTCFVGGEGTKREVIRETALKGEVPSEIVEARLTTLATSNRYRDAGHRRPVYVHADCIMEVATTTVRYLRGI